MYTILLGNKAILTWLFSTIVKDSVFAYNLQLEGKDKH